MRIGWHTDWGNNFPFDKLGLPDNYEQPSPAISVFGFSYDEAYVGSTGGAVWKGLALADEQVREAAALRGLTVPKYRKIQQNQYKEQVAALKDLGANKERLQ
jgi:hypothetical protein